MSDSATSERPCSACADQVLYRAGRSNLGGLQAVGRHYGHRFQHRIVQAFGQSVLDQQFLQLQVGARLREVLVTF